MPAHGQALPQAATESAREARKSFFCELCQKGYARMNEFEAHEGSYDHQHRKRLKEMKQISKDPTAAARAREADNKKAGLQSVSLGSGGAPKKKPVFKSTLQPQNASAVAAKPLETMLGGKGEDPSGAVRNGWADRAYDPLKGPTAYDPGFSVNQLAI